MRRIGSLRDVAERFAPGCRVAVHSACAVPPRLSAELVELAGERGPFALFDLVTVGIPAYVPGVEAGTLTMTTMVPGRAVRRALRAGKVTILRRPLSAAAALFASGTVPVDVLLLHCAPPDADGRLSLGVSVDAMPEALRCARTVIAEIDPLVPRTGAGAEIRADQVHAFLEGAGEGPLAVEPPDSGDAADAAIADAIAGLIRSGDVLQTGIGSIPDLTAARLGGLHGLGVHTGIVTEALRPLIESGAVDRPAVATLAAGSAAFYRFLDDNPAVQLLPCAHTHDAGVLAGIRNLVAINSALEIDLDGRINAESVEGRPVSGPGGQPDFASGAKASSGGRSIIALRAGSKDGTASRIVRRLDPAVAPTIDTGVVDYVVTEHGVARVSELSGAALARALAAVAAPDFRAALLRG